MKRFSQHEPSRNTPSGVNPERKDKILGERLTRVDREDKAVERTARKPSIKYVTLEGRGPRK